MENIIENFSVEKIKRYFWNKFPDFIGDTEDFSDILKSDEKFSYLQKIGETTLSDNKDILFFTCKSEKNLSERSAKKVQYEIAKRLMKQERKDSAIAIFYDEKGDFRFSFIRRNYGEDDKDKKYSSWKRYTYFVSKNQTNKTFLDRITNLDVSSLEKIQEAFSVEALSEEFFEKYKSHYEDFVQYISGKRFVKEKGKWVEKSIGKPSKEYISVFEKNDKSVRDFVKKMLGRIVFLHFLQKKRWLCNDENYLQNLFEKSDKKNYLENVLEPLFFGVLNTKSADRKVLFENENWDLSILKEWENIPYLNGGLFEKDELDKKKVIFPESLFSDLFDFFNQYNFTIDENDPNDSEVGIDPEMLGKIFENLLEDNKDKGAFYTPKEIVQYMCRESLIAYLCEKHKNDEKNIRDLVEHHIADWNEDTRKKILNSLKEVKICDPAIGSGAFPMGLLNELYKCRLALGEEKSVNIKKEIIQNNIYGVDIEKGAVDIARLRFWLALVVEEENAEPLPNLDYKIMQGNSLLESYQGIDLGNIGKEDTIILDELGVIDFGEEFKSSQQITTFSLKNSQRMQQLIRKYFATTENKFEKQKEINNLVEGTIHYIVDKQKREVQRKIDDFFKKYQQMGVGSETELEEAIKIKKITKTTREYKKYIQDKEELQKLSEIEREIINFQHKTERPYFLWHLFFSDVFKDGGFDIVIGNPPYIQLQKEGGKLAEMYKNENYQTFAKTGDIYQLFYEKGFQLLKQGGHLAYITSNKWMRAGYGEVTRKFFAKNTNPKILIDFGGVQVFESATVDTNILLFAKENNTFSTKAMVMGKDVKKEQLKNLSDYFRQKHSISKFSNDESWVILSEIEQRIKDKIEKVGVPLKDWDINIYRGILTGYNEAFIIDGSKRNEILANCQTENERQKTDELIRPLLRGRDIKRYSYDFADLYLICTFPSLKIDIELYPAVKQHLLSFGYDRLKQTGDKGARKKTNNKWFETQDSISYWEEFSKQKIVYSEIVKEPQFYLDNDGDFFPEATSFIMTGKYLEKLYHILHSKTITYFFKTFYAGGGLGKEGYRYKKAFLEKLPIPKKITEFETNSENVENTLFEIYNFTPEEIQFIENQ